MGSQRIGVARLGPPWIMRGRRQSAAGLRISLPQASTVRQSFRLTSACPRGYRKSSYSSGHPTSRLRRGTGSVSEGRGVRHFSPPSAWRSSSLLRSRSPARLLESTRHFTAVLWRLWRGRSLYTVVGRLTGTSLNGAARTTSKYRSPSLATADSVLLRTTIFSTRVCLSAALGYMLHN